MNPIYTVTVDSGCAVLWDKGKLDVPATAIKMALKIDKSWEPLRLLIIDAGSIHNQDFKLLHINSELFYHNDRDVIYEVLKNYEVYGIMMRTEEDGKKLEDELLKVYEWNLLKS